MDKKLPGCLHPRLPLPHCFHPQRIDSSVTIKTQQAQESLRSDWTITRVHDGYIAGRVVAACLTVALDSSRQLKLDVSHISHVRPRLCVCTARTPVSWHRLCQVCLVPVF